MEIIVVSDTHGNTSFVKKLVDKYPNAKYFLHAGDSELPERMIYPFESCQGNCDYYINNPLKIRKILGVGIYMFHGNRFVLEDNLLSELAKENECQIIIYGHTHIPYYNYYNGVHILCPGSIMYPRVSKPSYAIITFTNVNDIKIQIVNYNF